MRKDMFSYWFNRYWGENIVLGSIRNKELFFLDSKEENWFLQVNVLYEQFLQQGQ